MGVRAGIVVTGTEVLTGRVPDLNGPWLAEQLRRVGVDVGQVVVVGDRPDDLRSALEFLATGNDLVITSGGLGPTADDLTADIVAQVQGRPLGLDPDLEQRIAAIVERLSVRFGGRRDPAATAIATRKQAMVPVGATVLEPAGTAPGLVVPVASGRTGPPVVVLPGPPWELRQLWSAAAISPAVRAVLEGAPELRQRTLRLWSVPESELAATLRRAGDELDRLEITTCQRAGELEIVTRYPAEAESAQQRLESAVRADFPDQLFSLGETVDELVAAALRDRGWTVAVVEADTTGGALAARLATIPPADSGLLGAMVAATEAVLTGVIAVPATLIEASGMMSAPVARAMAERARAVFGADIGLGVTGIGPDQAGRDQAGRDQPGPDQAGPDRRAEGFGTVYLCVVTPDGEFARTLAVRGPADTVRDRIEPVALHLLRRAMKSSG
jgi:nicotinamide-nucleotide amidase